MKKPQQLDLSESLKKVGSWIVTQGQPQVVSSANAIGEMMENLATTLVTKAQENKPIVINNPR